MGVKEVLSPASGRTRRFVVWLRAGPVEYQAVKDVNKSIEEFRKRMDSQVEAMQSGDLGEFERRSSRFRNFLMSEMEQALGRIEKELDFAEGHISGGSRYHEQLVKDLREASEMLGEESVRLNNALSQARQRIDGGESLRDIQGDLLEVESREESNLEDAERKVREAGSIAGSAKLWFPYTVERFRRKIGRKESRFVQSAFGES